MSIFEFIAKFLWNFFFGFILLFLSRQLIKEMELTLGEDIISRARENWLAVVPFILAVARHQQQSKKVVKQILEQLSG